MQPQRMREHGTGQVGIDEDGPAGPPRQGAGQGQHQGGAAFGPMTAREQQDLDVLSVTRLDQAVGHLIEPVAPFALQNQDDPRPLKFLDRRGIDRLTRPRRLAARLAVPVPGHSTATSGGGPGRSRLAARGRGRCLVPWGSTGPVGGGGYSRGRAGRASLGVSTAQGVVNFPHGPAPRGGRRAEGSPETRPGFRCRNRRPFQWARSRARPGQGRLSLLPMRNSRLRALFRHRALHARTGAGAMVATADGTLGAGWIARRSSASRPAGEEASREVYSPPRAPAGASGVLGVALPSAAATPRWTPRNSSSGSSSA